MYNLDSEMVRGGTVCLSKAGLAEGTNANTLKTVAPNGAGVDYCIDGIMYHFTDRDNLVMTACALQTLLYSCLYLVTMNATSLADTVNGLTVVKGTQRLTADVTSGKHPLFWPQPTAVTECPIGGFRIDTTTVAFTSGTTDLAAIVAAGTVTYYDLFSIPTDPITS